MSSHQIQYSGPFVLRRQTRGAAGYDLTANEDVLIEPGGAAHLVGTGLRLALPHGTVGIIKSRSSMAAKHNLEAGAGVIDEDYRGEVKVLLRNFGKSTVLISPGMRIAQLLVLPVVVDAEPVGPLESLTMLPETERGEGGFGSTGQ